jgi:anaerobic selenocysteine-containing dehydrogenase
MRFTRRGFLQALGGTAGAVGLLKGPLSNIGKAAEELERWATPEEVGVASICQQCPGGCGLLVRTLDGEVAGISGNPFHPINRGAVCPKAFGGLQVLYDTSRLKGPMVRAGERGKFRSIGWDEALAMVSSRLSELRSKRLSHTLAILGGQYRGYRDTLWKRFTKAYGTPNYIRARCFTPEKPALAHYFMQGVTSPLSYDLNNAQLIISFGASLLEAWLGPAHVSQAFARLRRSSDRSRGWLIQVDPRRSPTAIKADRWIQIVPGTDGILALGIANAMIREGLYDRDFVAKHTFGFDDWTDDSGQRHIGFKNLVLRDYSLLAVSAATGVPVRSIIEIARSLATTKPAVVIGERGPAYGPDDLHTRMAIHSLNGLIGNIGVQGGLQIQSDLPLASFPRVPQDEAAKQGLAQPRIDGAGREQYLLVSDTTQLLPERMTNATPYPVNMLFLFATNPLSNHPAKEALKSAMNKIPFVVSFSPFLDESSAMADLILPDHTYLERWQDDPVRHLAGVSCLSIAQPAASPRHQTRNTADVILQIAKTQGGTVAQSFPWKTFEDVLYQGVRGLYEAKRGYIVSTHAEESLRKVLERQGYWVPEFEDYESFWKALVQRGAWWDPTGLPASSKALLRTPSGKFEFYSNSFKTLVRETVRKEGAKGPFMSALPAGRAEDYLFLPAVVIPQARENGLFPLRLNTYRLLSRPMGGGRNQPWLLEQPAVHVKASWEGWVEVHPETAAALGINDDDWVWVESKKGQIKLRARLYSGTAPDMVHIPLFGGGENPNDLIENEPDIFRGFGLFNTTQIRIRRV